MLLIMLISCMLMLGSFCYVKFVRCLMQCSRCYAILMIDMNIHGNPYRVVAGNVSNMNIHILKHRMKLVLSNLATRDVTPG